MPTCDAISLGGGQEVAEGTSGKFGLVETKSRLEGMFMFCWQLLGGLSRVCEAEITEAQVMVAWMLTAIMTFRHSIRVKVCVVVFISKTCFCLHGTYVSASTIYRSAGRVISFKSSHVQQKSHLPVV